MNQTVIYIFSFFIFILSFVSVSFEEIESAFSNGDAAKIMKYSNKRILINIDGEEGIYSSTQATQVLNIFFKNHPPSHFRFTFKGKKEEISTFAIGEYQSGNSLFRVSLKLKSSNNSHFIESIKIESKT